MIFNVLSRQPDLLPYFISISIFPSGTLAVLCGLSKYIFNKTNFTQRGLGDASVTLFISFQINHIFSLQYLLSKWMFLCCFNVSTLTKKKSLYVSPLWFSLQHKNTSCKELAQLSHLSLCGPLLVKFPALYTIFLYPLFRDSQGAREQRCF